VRWLSYRPAPTAIVRALHLQSPARRLYYRLFRAERNVVTAQCAGLSALFHASDPQEFRTIELAVLSERAMLEAVLSTLHPGDVFWDIGSNRGLFAIFAAQRVGPHGRVYAFEPESDTFDKLTANLQLNESSNVQPLRIALSDHRGSGSLIRASREGLSQGSRLGEDGVDTERVELVDGDGLSLSVPEAVKIDVEGHEYAVVRGMRRTLSQPRCRAVFCEIHPDRLPPGIDQDALCALIRELGFQEITVQQRGSELQATALKRGSA